MCSIAGWIADQPLDPLTARKLSAALLWYGAPRGDQSCGIWLDGRHYRAALPPKQAIYTPEFLETVGSGGTMCLLHTRQPTSGGRDATDAQPFVIDNTVSIHNGMISNCEELKKQFELEKVGTQVDSALVTAFVHKHGPQRLPDFIKAIRGSAAIAVIHDGAMWAMRDTNPLEYQILCFGDGAKITLFASTEHQLRDSMAHLWMLEPTMRTITSTMRQLFRVTPEGLTAVGAPVPFATSYGGWHRDDEDMFGGRSANGRRDRRRYQGGSTTQQGTGGSPGGKVVEPR